MTQSLALFCSNHEPTVTAEIPIGGDRFLSIGINRSGRLVAAIAGQSEHGIYHQVRELRPILAEGQYVEILPALALVRYGREIDIYRCGSLVGTCGVLAFAVALGAVARS